MQNVGSVTTFSSRDFETCAGQYFASLRPNHFKGKVLRCFAKQSFLFESCFFAQRTRPSHPHASTYEEDVSACIGIDRIQSRDMGTSRLRSMFHPQQRFTVWSISLRPSLCPCGFPFLLPIHSLSLWRPIGRAFWIQALQAAGKDLQEAPFQDGWVAQLLFLFESIIYILHTS